MTLDPLILQGMGVATGLAGMAAVTSPVAITRTRAFACWILSNFFLLGWAAAAGEVLLGILYAIYLALSTAGLVRSWKSTSNIGGTT